MDDKSFDSLIKKKVQDYQDSGHDPQALAAMRRSLSGLPVAGSSSNWKGHWGTLTALMLFTLFNFGMLWYFSEGRHAEINSELVELKAERAQWISLKDELIQWKSTNKVDTVYLVKEIIKPMSGSLASSTYAPNGNEPRSPLAVNQSESYLDTYIWLPEDEKLSRELLNFLKRQDLLLVGDQGQKVLVVKSGKQTPAYLARSRKKSPSLAVRLPTVLPKVWNSDNLIGRARSSDKNRISNKTLWALEKHQYTGLDFQFGLESMVTHTLPELGVGDVNTSLGLLTEVIFSPAIRLETGLHYGSRSYTVKEKELQSVDLTILQKFPGYDPNAGNLIRLESDAQVVKIPLNLKVMGILDRNKRWYASAGLSPQWLIEQEYDFQYAIEDDPGSDEQSGEFRRFIGAKQDITPGFSIGTLNLGIGTEVYLDKNTRWQIGAYYERGLEPLGAEKTTLQGVGLKTSFWLNTR